MDDLISRPMLKVPYGQDPYSVIGKYIRDHITAIEDIIAVIEINDITTNQLFMVDMNEENYFIWNNDWYEGEKDVALIDFFPVSEAINPSAQPEPCEDTISRQKAIEALCEFYCGGRNDCKRYPKCEYLKAIQQLPSAQPKQRWIPCGERLPEDDTEVFVYLFDRPSPYIAWVCDGCWFTEEFQVEKENYPIAWCELPEPYQAERREE